MLLEWFLGTRIVVKISRQATYKCAENTVNMGDCQISESVLADIRIVLMARTYGQNNRPHEKKCWRKKLILQKQQPKYVFMHAGMDAWPPLQLN